VIQLDIPDAVVLKRTAKSGTQSREVVEQRLKDYHRETDMLRVYFPGIDMVSLDGAKKPKQVAALVNAEMKKRFKLEGSRGH
jgi:adenylate kinase family enzyme